MDWRSPLYCLCLTSTCQQLVPGNPPSWAASKELKGPAQKDFYSTAQVCTAIAGTTTDRPAQHTTSHPQAAPESRQGDSPLLPTSALAGCSAPFSKGKSTKKQLSAAARSLAGSLQLSYVWGRTAFGALTNCEMFQKANSYWQWPRMEKRWHTGQENTECCLTQTTILKYLKLTHSAGEQHLFFMPGRTLISPWVLFSLQYKAYSTTGTDYRRLKIQLSHSSLTSHDKALHQVPINLKFHLVSNTV